MASTDGDVSADTNSAVGPILESYSKLYSRRVDIIGDYAGNEPFMIEGDSILLHCFSDAHIDFDPGYQLLHAAYTVETFLHNLVSRRANFHVVFFDEHRELCVPHFASADVREKYLLARAAVIRHLKVNLKATHPEIEVHVFTSVRAESFSSYLEQNDHFFVMCHDGASSASPQKRSAPVRDLGARDEEHGSEESALQSKTRFRLLIFWFMQNGYNAVLLNGLEWRDTKAIATVLEQPRIIDSDIDSLMAKEDLTKANPNSTPDWDQMLDTVQSAVETDLTEREFLAVLCVSKLIRQDAAAVEFAAALLRHVALLSQLGLPERRYQSMTLSTNFVSLLDKFCSDVRTVVESEDWAEDIEEYTLSCDVADLVDGRLLAACLNDSSLGAGTERFQLLLRAAAALSDAESLAGAAQTKNQQSQAVSTRMDPPAANQYAVLPFSNGVLDKHLSPIQLAIDSSGDMAEATSAAIFREAAEWHGSKRPIDPRLREEQAARNQKQQFFARRRNQWFMAEMMAYAASLTNAVGKVLEPEIITSGGKSKTVSAITETEETPKPKSNQKSSKKNEPTRKQAMMAKIAADKSRKDEASSEKVLQGWKMTCKNIEQEQSPVARYQAALQYLTTLNSELKRETLEAEVRFYMLNNLLTMWINACKQDQKDQGMHVAALIFDSIRSFPSVSGITKTIATHLKTIVKLLELPPLSIPTPESDRALTFAFALKSSPTANLAIPLGNKQFQLLHCGPYFERSIDSAPDPRTPFDPDAWQRQVLDGIDAKRSLLVIAPTSAGKTFISFYAMKQVLESSDDDVLVYVAPTKALVNQIAAEIQARFSKQYKYAGNSVWGIHTRDYRINNPIGCQILVTVPHILQTMLLTPSNAKSWSERVKWIIFDEVHCMGQAEDGLVWEQLLLQSPCPIIALSATIGNPGEFNDWLGSAQKANNLLMVQHPHRYSDLRKFVYTPEDTASEDVFEGLSEPHTFGQLGLDNDSNFTFLHPVASLVNRSRGVPDDFSLEARDCYTLWQSMTAHQTPQYPIDKSLDPAVALPGVIKKIDIIKWAAALKDVLRVWLADNESPFPAVFRELSPPMSGGNQESSISLRKAPLSRRKETPKTENGETQDDDEHDTESILHLLAKLHEQAALPGIVFNYDRGLCEKMCRHLLEQLSAAESAWKETNPKWKSTLKKWEEWKKMMAKSGKRAPKAPKKKGGEEGLTKEDMMRENADTEASPWASFEPEKPVDGFHFANRKRASNQELDRYERDLTRRGVSQWLLDSLRRGIGVHHAGMNRKYRHVVEVLFRKGFLRVVIATGTLALGINMPCKTVIFSGDSIFLTALNYRQAAGRAGRRGFDMLGNVVFHDISPSKVHRLISSRLPDLNGHFPVTTTLVLRLFALLSESKESPFAIRSVNSLLSQPRLYLGGNESKITMLHHLRFTIEYLRRQHLLDSRGSPLNLAGCISHLYFTENASFALHALMKDGYLHKLCGDIDNNPEPVLKELMLTMAHLFGRQFCRKADEEHVEEVIQRSQSMVFLPPMPEKAADVLRKHNSTTLEIFTAYVRTFVEQNIQEADDVLPLTGVKVSKKTSDDDSHSTKARSSFVALSGHDDKFDSIHDLCTTSRSGVFLEEAIVPYVGIYPEETELPLNAYLYDFFIHGDVEALISANRIQRGDVWFVLNDFSMILATIVTSLSSFMNLTSASDLTDVKGEGEEEEERQEDKLLPPDDSGYETGSTVSMASKQSAAKQALPIQVKKKKKVADSWDDDADEEDIEEEVAQKEKKMEDEMQKLLEKPDWEEGKGLLNVLTAFKLLREDFDTKFRAMWA
ncbi:P-loop containing nucleoside triphosphate hydrolase protein [Corynespora cassiicola Philippines]|uniref:P-loop containing nucleoside triphosphate hydrolase protein n=1 Tax=Corynespora cassiicola Philippines TaxID=1448308 RepID=A0A2T2PAB2_CORCC|nr:P-loop containing nucleoside triphosphate hydrolase protein [Corynespora cassiicola Philippines]